MPFRRGGRRRGSIRGARRRLQWQRFYVADNGLGPVVAGTIAGAAWWVRPPAGRCAVACGSDVKVEEDWTHVRTIWDVKTIVQSSFAASGQGNMFRVAAGILEWNGIDDTNPAFIDVPDPGEEADADWLIWSSGWTANLGLGASIYNIQANLNATDLTSTTRAQRKLSADNGLLFVISVRNENQNAASITWGYGAIARSLYKLP